MARRSSELRACRDALTGIRSDVPRRLSLHSKPCIHHLSPFRARPSRLLLCSRSLSPVSKREHPLCLYHQLRAIMNPSKDSTKRPEERKENGVVREKGKNDDVNKDKQGFDVSTVMKPSDPEEERKFGWDKFKPQS